MPTMLDPEVEEPRVYQVTLLDLWTFYVTISDLQALGFQAIAVQAPPIMSRVMRIEPFDSLTLADILPGLDVGQVADPESDRLDLDHVDGLTAVVGSEAVAST